MSDPLVWRILEDVKTALEGISISNDYRRDVQHVSYFGTKGFDAEPDAIWISAPTSIVTISEPVQSTTCTLTFSLYCRLYDEEDIVKAILVMSSDIVKAVLADERRGGLADGTLVTNECRSPVLFVDKENEGGFAMDLEVVYDHTLADPDTVIGG